MTYFRGSELQGYFQKVLEENIKAIIKPQYVDHIPRAVKGKVKDILLSKDEKKIADEVIDALDLKNVLDRNIADLSGGELQRFAIGIACVQKADVYMFDEPSSYLDIRQRLKAAQIIRSLIDSDKYEWQF